MLLVTKQHHERDEEKTPDKERLSDIGQVSLQPSYSFKGSVGNHEDGWRNSVNSVSDEENSRYSITKITGLLTVGFTVD